MSNTGDMKKGKNNKMRQSQAIPIDPRKIFNQVGPQIPFVQQSADMLNFKNSTSPGTAMNFFKGNATQQIINQKYPSSGNRKSQSTGRQA